MGDRGNVVLRTSHSGDLYLYTHWGGDSLPMVVQEALARKARWDDPAYLARIVFCAMVRGNEDGETGFGISTFLGDNEHPLLVIDCATRQVRFEADPNRAWTERDHGVWTFQEFVEASATVLARAWKGKGK